MVQVDIHIPRPWLTLSIIAGVALFVWNGSDAVPADALGGNDGTDAMVVHEAEQDVKKLREKQDVLDRREEILRADLAALEEELSRTQSQATAAQLVAAREELLELLEDRRAAESQILLSLQQIWDAQGVAITASRLMDGEIAPTFDWPVEPALGISAHFHDAGYKKRFGMEHQAVDIPVLQGSTVYAAAAGAVVKVSDNGKGYSSLVISHDGGFSTLYGHVSAFLVKEGDAVRAGQAVALSGGTPGTNGAGRMTTGAHLHFEVIRQGAHVDPLQVLPERSAY
jgi:murein DD-endopeptidase MepM/ murein hydrolase activator NlpD